jgi:putative ABC transport system permease protein
MKNMQNIYRIISRTDDTHRHEEYASAPSGLIEDLRGVHGIDQAVRINSGFGGILQDQQLSIQGYFVDPEFLNVFTFPLTSGNSKTALQKKSAILITEKAAIRIFNSVDVIGKIMTLEGLGDFEITGVLRDIPKNSHMTFEALTSYETFLSLQYKGKIYNPKNPWTEFRNSYIYFVLPEERSVAELKVQINSSSKGTYASIENFQIDFDIQPLSKIAPGQELSDQIGPDWGYASLSIFMLLTLLILIPACFNYASISISRALKRMKEIGIRKAMGGQRNQIFLQFITETVIINMIALALSYYMFTIIRTEFLHLIVNGNESLDLSPDLRTILCFILFGLLVALAAGYIPARYFAKMNPVNALKSGKSVKKISSLSFRKLLIISQFSLSLVFILSVAITLNQYRQTMNYDFGFNQENILDVPLKSVNPNTLRNEFSKLSEVQSISMSSHILGTQSLPEIWVREPDKIDSVAASQMYIDGTYLANLGLALVAGENFDVEKNAITKSIIVNEKFLQSFGIQSPSDVLGKSFQLSEEDEVTVIGVVKDFHYQHLREPVGSFFFRYDPDQLQIANIKLLSSDIFTTISSMEASWKTFAGEEKFEAKFFEDEIDEAYSFFFSMIKICGFLGFLAITISCLGLLGMVVFTVENRTKEVGIRKSVGATTENIVMILSRDFVKLMMISIVIATPLTYLFFDRIYLATQPAKMPIGLAEILISIGLLMVLGLATILSQTIKAARANPVDILKYE